MSLQNTIEQLRTLKLNGMISGLEQQLSQTAFHDQPFESRLGMLVDAETSYRDSNRLKRLLKNAKLKVHAHPEELDHRPGRGLDRATIADLLTCEWIRRQQNLIITGLAGTGKTWIACCLAMQAARRGIPVLYWRVGRLLEELAIAHEDGSIVKYRNQLARAQLLILDDFGLMPLPENGKGDLLELLDDRVGTGSTVVVGQMPAKDWHDYINNPALADAILDRLIHSAHRLSLKGESMRKVTAADSRKQETGITASLAK